MAWRASPFSVRHFAFRVSIVKLQSQNPRHPLLLRPSVLLFHSSTRQKFRLSGPKLDDLKPTFQYPPLNLPNKASKKPTIRLFTLLPGSTDDPIQCHLSVAPLSTTTQYEAISYCWGDPTDTESITCNSSPLTIPWNLAAALRGLRLLDNSRTLWADAICINQSSTTEKDSQVQLMRDIFSCAHRTLIWLGTTQDKHEEGISRFATTSLKIGLAGIRWLTRSHIMPSVGVQDARAGDGGTRTLEPFSAEFYLALVRFLRRPWFRRAWVVQEVVVSRRPTLLWDLCEYEWADVVRALKVMASVKFPLAFLVSLQHMASIEHERQRYRSGNVEFLGLLLRQQRCLSTDPRDKVFSFCGLINDSERESVRISYLNDTATVYRNLASRILRRTQSLDMLSKPPLPEASSPQDLPSWVPDWSMCSSTGRFHGFSIGPRSLAGTEVRSSTKSVPRFRTAGGSSYMPTNLTASDELAVEGYAFDKIIEVGPVFEGTELPNAISTFKSITEGWRHTLRTFLQSRTVIISWQKMISAHSNNLSYKSEPLDEVFWQTLCAGELFESVKVASAARFWKRVTRYSGFIATHVPRWLDNIGVSYCVSILVWQLLFRQPLLEYELQGRYTLNRRIVITEKGYVGLATCSAKAGDQIAICKGSSVPLVLSRSKSLDRWKLVGDAYVHGIMKGELFEKSSCKLLVIV